MSAEPEATGRDGRAAAAPPGPAVGGPGGDRAWGDYGVPALVFLFCAAVIAVSLTFDEVPPIIVGDSMQPRVFPIFLMAVIGILNLVLIVQLARGAAMRRALEPPATWLTVLLLCLFYLLVEFVDIMLALAGVMLLLCLVWGERRWWAAVLVALVTTSLIFFSFDLVLKVRFPRGLLTDWYYG